MPDLMDHLCGEAFNEDLDEAWGGSLDVVWDEACELVRLGRRRASLAASGLGDGCGDCCGWSGRR